MITEVDLIKIKTIKESSGNLSFLESNKDIDFDIKRIYYITNVGKGEIRGFHAHRTLKQLLICINGEIEIVLDNGKSKRRYLLKTPEKGLLVDSCLWRTMKFIDENSILLVAASAHYDENDYIKNYEEFIIYINENKGL